MQLEAVIRATGFVPAVNQIERHPLLLSKALISYCSQKNIHITAYSAFGNNMIGEPLLIARNEVKEVANSVSHRLGTSVTPSQVILAWSQVGNHSVIPKSVTPHRIVENFQEVDLTPEEVEEVAKLGENPRRYNVPLTANKPRWNINIFGEEEEGEAGQRVNVGV